MRQSLLGPGQQRGTHGTLSRPGLLCAASIALSTSSSGNSIIQAASPGSCGLLVLHKKRAASLTANIDFITTGNKVPCRRGSPSAVGGRQVCVVYALGLRRCSVLRYKTRPAGVLAAARARQSFRSTSPASRCSHELYEIMIFKRRVCVASEVFALTRWAPPRPARRGSAAQVKMAR